MRERRIVACLGAQGSGKTSLATALADAARARGERLAVLDPNGRIKGGVFPLDTEAWLTERIQRRDASMLWLDDADGYVPKTPRPTSPWRQVALRNRHVDLDVLLTARRLAGLPVEMVSGIDVIFVFQVSQADVPGIRRLLTVAPNIQLPTRPFEFVRLEPKTATGNARRGRTLRRAPWFELL